MWLVCDPTLRVGWTPVHWVPGLRWERAYDPQPLATLKNQLAINLIHAHGATVSNIAFEQRSCQRILQLALNDAF